MLAAYASAAGGDDPLANLTDGDLPAPEPSAPSAWVRSLLVTGEPPRSSRCVAQDEIQTSLTRSTRE
jgi:hypothetical protein